MDHAKSCWECRLSPEVEEGALRCAAFLMKYHGLGENLIGMDRPVSTITTKDRLALVTAWIGDDPYVIVDIQFRMLQPHELYAAQGFLPNHIIDRGHDGRTFKRASRCICAATSALAMAAIARANDPHRQPERQTLAA